MLGNGETVALFKKNEEKDSHERHRNGTPRAQQPMRARDRAAASAGAHGKRVDADPVRADLLEAVIEPGDRVCLEGNNQKQADFLAEALARCSTRQRVHDLHMRAVGAGAAEHLDLFEQRHRRRSWTSRFPVRRVRGSRSWSRTGQDRDRRDPHLPRTVRALLRRPDAERVALVAAQAADAHGNLYTGPNTEDTPAIVEATAFKGGIVIAQVNELVNGDAAARRHPGGLGRLLVSRHALTSSSRCSPAIRRRSATSRC